MAYAFDMYDEIENRETHFLFQKDVLSLSFSADAIDCEQPTCNHFCHITAHLIGIARQTSQVKDVKIAMVFLPQQEQQRYSQILEPPFHPPIA